MDKASEINNAENYIYKFRSTYAILDGYNELRNEEIYFSPLDDLNDPIEGFMDVYWQGDTVLWTNFYKNYLYNLFLFHSNYCLAGDTYKIENKHIHVAFEETLRMVNEFPGRPFPEICDIFFENEIIKKHIEDLASGRKILKNELALYLNLLQIFMLNIIDNVSIKHHKVDKDPDKKKAFEDISKKTIEKFENLSQTIKKIEHEKINNFITTQFHKIQSQVSLLSRANSDGSILHINYLMLLDFPNIYLNKVKEVMYPEYYVSCFSIKCDDASMWGYYADSHKGVCLKFKPNIKNDTFFLPIEIINGHGLSRKKDGQTIETINKEFIEHRLKTVGYKDKYEDVPFFRSLGMQTHPVLNKYWYYSDGIKSEMVNDILQEEDCWRYGYWEWIENCVCTKTVDWEHEKEYRIVLTSMFGDTYDTINKRKIKYKFENLDGIIFGIKTSIEDKIKIIKIITEKCKKYRRKDFNFYQANYNNDDGKIYTYKLDLLKLPELNTSEDTFVLHQ